MYRMTLVPRCLTAYRLASAVAIGSTQATIILNSNNNVGINTTTPGNTLDVIGSAMFGNNPGTTGRVGMSNNEIKFVYNGQAHWSIYNSRHANGALTIANTSGTPNFGDNGTVAMSVSAGGNVGINTATPAARLTVHNTASAAVDGNPNSWANSLAFTGLGRAWSMGVEGTAGTSLALGFFCYNTLEGRVDVYMFHFHVPSTVGVAKLLQN